MTLIIVLIIGIVWILLYLHVDDNLIVGNDVGLKCFLKSHFEMKDLCEVLYVLCIQVIRDRKCRTLYIS
jgi:hypothetical protein